jgi:predicted metal-dependent hydrolase
MYTIAVSGIEIIVEKKRIKNMYIRVLPPEGTVRMTAPLYASGYTVRMFAVSRIAWIKKQKSKFADQPRQTERQYVSGESCYLWGQRYRLEVVCSNVRNDVSVRDQQIVLQVRKDSTPAQRGSVMDEWYRKILKSAIPPVLERCEQIVGVKANEWQVKNMRTRWGTCSIPAKRIWLNLQLVKKPPECLEYVIIHELVHLLEKNHNEVFKGYMDKFYPDWRIVKQRLNSQKLGF